MGAARRRRRPAGGSLTRGEEFQAVYRDGIRHASPVGVIFILPRGDRQIRLGIPAGRRLGTAVVRNRLRRRIREAFRSSVPAATGGADVVIVPRSAAATADYAQIVDIIRKSLIESGIIGQNSA